jgi:hypothetical protein
MSSDADQELAQQGIMLRSVERIDFLCSDNVLCQLLGIWERIWFGDHLVSSGGVNQINKVDVFPPQRLRRYKRRCDQYIDHNAPLGIG